MSNHPRMNKLTLHFKSSKRHMKASERDELLLSGEIEPISATEYRYIAKPRILNSFQALANLKLTKPAADTGFLEGHFIIERAGKRSRDIQAKPGQLEIQLRLQAQTA